MQQQQIITGIKPRSRNWLPILNALYYVALAVAVVALGLYFYANLGLITLYLPFLLQAAALTIGISAVSMILAMTFGFIGAFGSLSRFAPLRTIAIVDVERVR